MNKSNSDIRISPCLAACKNSENISATLWTHIFLILRVLERLKIHRDLVSRRIITGIEFSRYVWMHFTSVQYASSCEEFCQDTYITNDRCY